MLQDAVKLTMETLEKEILDLKKNGSVLDLHGRPGPYQSGFQTHTVDGKMINIITRLYECWEHGGSLKLVPPCPLYMGRLYDPSITFPFKCVKFLPLSMSHSMWIDVIHQELDN